MRILVHVAQWIGYLDLQMCGDQVLDNATAHGKARARDQPWRRPCLSDQRMAAEAVIQ
jgi:hypothetical protein